MGTTGIRHRIGTARRMLDCFLICMLCWPDARRLFPCSSLPVYTDPEDLYTHATRRYTLQRLEIYLDRPLSPSTAVTSARSWLLFGLHALMVVELSCTLHNSTSSRLWIYTNRKLPYDTYCDDPLTQARCAFPTVLDPVDNPLYPVFVRTCLSRLLFLFVLSLPNLPVLSRYIPCFLQDTCVLFKITYKLDRSHPSSCL